MSNSLIGICIGDVTGIGPEVTLKAVAEEMKREDGFDYLLIGDGAYLRKLNEKLGLGLAFGPETTNSQVRVREAGVDLPTSVEQGSKAAADAAMVWLKEAGEDGKAFRRELMKQLDEAAKPLAREIASLAHL